MVGCAALGCKNYSVRMEPGVTFHRFPKEIDKRKIWINNMNLKVNWQPSIHDRLCSDHFEPRFFYRTDLKVRLLHQAVPTRFLHGLNLAELQYIQPKIEPKEAESKPMPSASEVEQDTLRKKKLKRQLLHELDERVAKLKRELVHQIAESRAKTKEIRVLGQSVKRAKKRAESLKQIIKELQKNELSQETVTKIENISFEN